MGAWHEGSRGLVEEAIGLRRMGKGLPDGLAVAGSPWGQDTSCPYERRVLPTLLRISRGHSSPRRRRKSSHGSTVVTVMPPPARRQRMLQS